MCRDQRDHSVSASSKPVHPRGHPISHSTNRGLSFGRDAAPVPVRAGRPRPELWPVVTASESETPAFAFDPGAFRLPELFESPAVGVGQHEDPLTPMRGADSGSRKHVPRTAIPEIGQFSDPAPESIGVSNSPPDVFQEDEARSHFPHDAGNVRPEVALVGSPKALSSSREGRAGEPRQDEIHAATPRSTAEGGEIVPDRSWIQGLRFHPCHEEGRSEGFPLDVADSSSPSGQGEVNAEVEPTGSRAEREGSDGRCSHVKSLTSRTSRPDASRASSTRHTLGTG